MARSSRQYEEWSDVTADLNEAFLDAYERNAEMQAEAATAWMDAMEDAWLPAETIEDGVDGYARAYRVWIGAVEEQFEQFSDALEGEDVAVEDVRDVWLTAANEAFKEVMSTTAFAAATGEGVDALLEVRQQLDDATESTLHAAGFATESDVREVGERLVELERRQHAVEEKLDWLIETLDR